MNALRIKDGIQLAMACQVSSLNHAKIGTGIQIYQSSINLPLL